MVALPSDKQVGGDHYKDMAIELSEFIHRNGIGWLEGNAIKYIVRHGRKHDGAEDIDKAIHYLELLKEWKYAEAPPAREKPLWSSRDIDAYIGRLNTGWDKTGL